MEISISDDTCSLAIQNFPLALSSIRISNRIIRKRSTVHSVSVGCVCFAYITCITMRISSLNHSRICVGVCTVDSELCFCF